MVRGHMCDNSSKPLWLTAACSTGTLDMVLGWISPDLVARQVSWNDMNVVIINRRESQTSKSVSYWLCAAGFAPFLFSRILLVCVILSFYTDLDPQVSPSEVIRFRVHRIISLRSEEGCWPWQQATANPRWHLGNRHLKEIQLAPPLW